MSDPPADLQEARAAGLARDVLRGEADAFDRWFREEHRQVWKLCFGLLADAAEADDLAQDAMLHLHDHLSAWNALRSYRTWRNAVVANLCRDRLRRLGARRDAEQGAAEVGLPDRLPRPEDRARHGELREALRVALATLTPREREVFVLRDLEGEPTRAVARSLGIEEGSVRSLSTLARRRLRQTIGARLPGLVPEGGAS